MIARIPFFARRTLSRRHFFEIVGAGVTGSFLAPALKADDVVSRLKVNPQNTARNVIFILLAGAPSHADTFDLKEIPGVTPASFQPETIGGIRWPVGLMPKLRDNLADLALVRTVQAWALQHSLSQTWTQIGRNPAAVLGDIAPNIGSIVAAEKERERTPSQVFPTFLALNASGAVGSGYLPAAYAPFRLNPATQGLPNTVHVPDGEARFNDKWQLLRTIDGPLRVNSPLGQAVSDYDTFYQAAKGLMYNPVVDQAFRFTAADSQRYGNNAFGNACLVAVQALAANQGTRFIDITLGGWDHHQDIYSPNNLPRMAKLLDDGLSALIVDLKATGLFNETLLVMMGEFGRTVGKLTPQSGRDHYPQQFCVFAGAGVRGGRALGATDATGSATTEYAWGEQRNIRPEDIEATIYSALGINWTNIRYDDPFGRGFEYVPGADQGAYRPIDELWPPSVA